MEIAFNVSFGRLVFDMSIEYEADDLQFSSKIHATPDNVAHILQRYNRIDQVNKVTLRGLAPVHYRYIEHWKSDLLCECVPIGTFTPANYFKNEQAIEFTLNATLYFYKTGTIINWQPDCKLPIWLAEIMKHFYLEFKPLLVGTVMHHLPILKAQAKAIVTANSIRRARIMSGNAEAILEFLGEVI